jgi:signal transduction histidine kinase/DNA-binding response OmpR family regulator
MAFTPQGKVWLATFGHGLFYFDPSDGLLTRHVNRASENPVNANQILSLQWIDGKLLVGTSGAGLWRFDPSTQTYDRPGRAVESLFLRERTIRNIFVGHDHYWFYFPTRLLKTDKEFSVTQEFVFPSEWKFWAGIRDNVARDSLGAFWIATQENGLFSYDPRSGALHNYKMDRSRSTALRANQLYSVLVDRQQNVWTSTYDRGVEELRNVPLVFHNLFLPFGGTPGSPEPIEAAGKEFILMESKSEGLFQAELAEKLDQVQFQHLPTPRELQNIASVNSLVGQRHWWIGTWNYGVFGLPRPANWNFPNAKVTHLRLDGSLVNKNTIKGPFSGVLYEEGERYLWFFSPWSVLNRYDISKPYGSEGSLRQFKHNPQDPQSVAAGRITDFVPLGQGKFLVTTDTGLDEFDGNMFRHLYTVPKGAGNLWRVRLGADSAIWLGGASGLLHGVPSSNGYTFTPVISLQNKVVAGIEVDHSGRLWLNTYEGIYLYDPVSQSTVRFTEEDGIANREAAVAAHAVTARGLILFGNAESVVLFDPKAYQPRVWNYPPVLTDLRINNKPAQRGELSSLDINSESGIELNYTQDVFTLEFSGMDHVAPDKTAYTYRLDGFDDDWITAAPGERSVTYTNLDPGSYQFRVRAGENGKERTLAITILPPPWRTWWAYAGYWALGAGLLVLARRTIVQRERLKSNLKLAKLEQEKEHFELEKAKEVDRVKTSFFTNISHEFRTPLTLIKGPVDTMLERYKDDPEAVNRLKLVKRNSDVLLKLINQLLDLAKLESGTLKVEKTDGQVYSFIKGVAGSFESMARQKGIELNVHVPGEPCAARFDKDKVETILINLINNAIKFTPSGGEVKVSASVEWEVTTAEAQRRRVALVLTVSDTGIGIPPEHQAKVFERFHQVSEAHEEVGTGIGLALVKELVTLMGGEISVWSEQGKGSTFTVTLPLEAASSDKPQAASEDELRAASREPLAVGANRRSADESVSGNGSASSLQLEASSLTENDSRPQVLVVEDNADLRTFIIDSLGTEFKFYEAENGKQGLEIATTEIPDMIISDVMMPEMDGMEMTRRIKEDIKTSHIPLILLTAKSGEDSKLEGLSKGADDYLTKPFNKQELLLKVRNGTARMLKIREKMKAEVLSSAPMMEVLSADEQFLNKVKETILERMSDEQLSVESLADDIGMSRVQLYRKVSALTGMAVNELIRKLRLQRAAQLLSQNWGPVSQVAYEVGFSNLSYFSKVFKEDF